MPLVRCEVRNEFGLGHPELYGGVNREDPKAVLDGVAVAGLVGILRQLGDLAEFAAEVFHGLQEQVMTTASRSHKLMARVQNIEAALPPLEKVVLAQTSHIHFAYTAARVQNIEAALPPLEKVVLAQTSHIHFAYTAGSEWHSHIQNEQNHFIYNDLPRFIMDSYEECRDPPRLHLLDKFDTGGPGSCLKRYSDPTFFRRVSGDFKEPDAEKVQKEKKARKNKKKRSSQRNRDLLHSASMSNHNNRMHFSPTVDGRTSPSHTASTFDTTLKSDTGDHSNSFDSRTGSGYIECLFHLNGTVRPEEQESNDASSNLMEHNNIPDSHHIADENFTHSSLPDLSALSSCVTWDEKVEIVESEGKHNDSGGDDEAPEMLTTVTALDTQEKRNPDHRNPDQAPIPQTINLDAAFYDVNAPKPSSSENHLDEVESEPDNYMDALNTIESESENDTDCQTKREVAQSSLSLNNKGLEDGIHEVATSIPDHQTSKYQSHAELDHQPSNSEYCAELDVSDHPSKHNLDTVSIFLDHQPSEYESHTASVMSHHPPSISESHTAAITISNKERPSGIPLSVPSKNFADEQTPNVSRKTSNSYCCSPGIEGSADTNILYGSTVECDAGDPSSSGSGRSNLQEPLSDNKRSSLHESQESQIGFSGAPPISFWTNGGLLGLQPSKPPDFTLSNSGINDYVARSKEAGPPNHTLILDNDREIVTPGKLVKDFGSMETISSSKCAASWLDGQDVKVEKSTHTWTPGNKLENDSDVKAASEKASQESVENSSQMFGFGHRLLANGFRRKLSLVSDGKPEVTRSLKLGTLEQSEQNGSTYKGNLEKASHEQFELKSFVDSLTSSPPLEHMKISFKPIDGYDDSKLKLKFPDGSQSNESIRDMFPSFQLVPEPATRGPDVESDSDDDTFCRSSPYASEDCLSRHSDTDSEQWDSGESPERKDPELYDTLGRMSIVESVSNSLEHGETGSKRFHTDTQLRSSYAVNGIDPSLSAAFLDLPSFDAVNLLTPGETKDDLDPVNLLELQYPRESNPMPPPLPPIQWRAGKHHSDTLHYKQDSTFDAAEYAFDQELQGTTVGYQLNPASANVKAISEEKTEHKKDQWILNYQKEVNQPTNGRAMDEKEDFLQQIRTKSFNLRRTATAKSAITSGPATNNKVAAILKKANAIRQAVGSDDGEDDDSWSDA